VQTKIKSPTKWTFQILFTSVAHPDPDPQGSEFIWPDPEFGMPDPDPRLQNWHLINLFSVEKYCE
jgi:hypothetical protein